MKNILMVILAILAVVFGYFYFFPKYPTQTQETAEELPTELESTVTPAKEATPTSVIEDATISGWKVYSNAEYGFKISYPQNYQALNDATNLYGWKNGVVLFYKGGQSYDLVLQVWNSKAEYEAVYKNDARISVKQVGNKFITLLNQNQTGEVEEIIQTFKVVE